MVKVKLKKSSPSVVTLEWGSAYTKRTFSMHKVYEVDERMFDLYKNYFFDLVQEDPKPQVETFDKAEAEKAEKYLLKVEAVKAQEYLAEAEAVKAEEYLKEAEKIEAKELKKMNEEKVEEEVQILTETEPVEVTEEVVEKPKKRRFGKKSRKK